MLRGKNATCACARARALGLTLQRSPGEHCVAVDALRPGRPSTRPSVSKCNESLTIATVGRRRSTDATQPAGTLGRPLAGTAAPSQPHCQRSQPFANRRITPNVTHPHGAPRHPRSLDGGWPVTCCFPTFPWISHIFWQPWLGPNSARIEPSHRPRCPSAKRSLLQKDCTAAREASWHERSCRTTITDPHETALPAVHLSEYKYWGMLFGGWRVTCHWATSRLGL